MRPNGYHIAPAGLLGMMFLLAGRGAGGCPGSMLLLAGGAALRESGTVDEVSHVAAGLSYWQRLDLRVNPEHPPLAKLIAAAPNAIRGARADYSSPAWQSCAEFFQAYGAQWVFGDAV